MKTSLLKTQIQIRKKVLKQKICITFSHLKKQRPLSEIVKELANFVSRNTPFSDILCTPEALVGRRIKHKFEIDGELGETKWYSGIIVHYNGTTKAYEISYDDEDEHCFFDITIDLVNGDLILD